jgi:hypothetical protein
MFRKALLAAACAGGLAACETGPTPYQAADGGRSGYSETRIENDRYRISFSGNSLTDRETVENYLLYRAAETTLQNGYDHFTIVNRDVDKDRRITQSGGWSPFWSYRYFHPRYGWIGAYDPFYEPATYRETTRYEAFAEIRMGRGPKGGDPNSFDAREVSQNLAPAIRRPAR